jgi:hypothetical protein
LTLEDLARIVIGAQSFATTPEATTMQLLLIGKDPESNPSGSPTVYRTDRDTWVVQGWKLTDPEALAQMDMPDEEGAVEIPDRMIQFFRQEGRDLSNG